MNIDDLDFTKCADLLGPNLKDFDKLMAINKNDMLNELGSKDSDIHLRIQQRNGHKCWTIIENINVLLSEQNIKILTKSTTDMDIKEFTKKLLPIFTKSLCCNGSIKEDNNIYSIHLNGDHRDKISQFLTKNKMIKKSNIKIHGF